MSEDVRYGWRGPVGSGELGALHREGFGVSAAGDDRAVRLDRHSLGWVTARRGGDLVGFVNVAWDGGAHAFLLDTVVASAHRRHGIGAGLVARARAGALTAGCEWLHVDCASDVWPFYAACGFDESAGGVSRLAS